MRAVFQAIAWASLPSDIKPHAMAVADKTALKDAVRAAAGVLYDSALGRRLMSMPVWQLEIADARSSSDCLVTDRKGRLHLIALTMSLDVFAAGAVATAVASDPDTAGLTRIGPFMVHILSLTTGKRMAFLRDMGNVRGGILTCLKPAA